MSAPDPTLAPSGAPWRTTPLASFPPPERWDDWEELDAKAWPKRVTRRYQLVPTTCFNCEAACGLVAYVDRETGRIRKLEGNPYHPGSRGRNCAKGPATLSQVEDPDRILFPMRRVGPRGSGKFERTTWAEALAAIAGRMREALVAGRRKSILYHVGRPGHDGAMEPILRAWGVDGHNSHTNICSAAARLGYALWSGCDRPSPDYANANFILLVSAHLESGHYFNPHAQRIMEAKAKGAKLATVDVRLSNTAAMSDHWLAPWPGTEAALLLGFAREILAAGLEDREFLARFTNWEEYLAARGAAGGGFEAFLASLRADLDRYTPEWTAGECGVDAEKIVAVAREIGAARGRFASHVWRSAASGNLGGWQVARCLFLLAVLTGSVATKGGTGLASASKFKPKRPLDPPPVDVWNELLYPPEWPLAHHEMSFLLPHFLLEGRGRLDVYFTRVYNPVWTNPDGFTWMRALSDESLVGLHVALTPVWSETALFADYVLPMGLAPERHDLMSQETHAGTWISFRQPVLRVARERVGDRVDRTWQANPGEVWEEDEFWIDLSVAVDPDGSLGIRKHFESPYRKGETITIEEQYRWIFEHSVPGLPEAAAKAGLSPLEFMRRRGAFEVSRDAYGAHEAPGPDGRPRGFRTPSGRLEIHSGTMVEWGLSEQAGPAYIESHVHPRHVDAAAGRFVLTPTFRLPTLVHTRSGNAKWLMELSNANPVWIHTGDADRLGLKTGDLVRVTTRIGHFVNRAWVTEAIRPGVVACSHHLGRWRPPDAPGGRLAAATVTFETLPDGRTRVRRLEDLAPFESKDPDTRRVYWTDGGVHQNLAFPVQPDPISGMHCWHQLVTVSKAGAEDQYGDVVVDHEKSMAVYREWTARARPPADPPGGLRRPLWFDRAVRPADSAYRLPGGR